MTKQDAIDELFWLDGGVAVGIQTGNGIGDGKIWYAARNRMEAQRWVNFNKDYIVPGTQPEFYG